MGKRITKFTAPWCTACRNLEPALKMAEANGIPVERVNVDEHPERAAEHGITSLPVTILEQEGQAPTMLFGASPSIQQQIINWVA